MVAATVTTNLFVALIVLTSSILISILLYLLIHYMKRPKHHERVHSLEARQIDERDKLSHRFSPQHTPTKLDLERLRRSSTPLPFELLPQIQISKDKADEWLERGKGERLGIVEADVGVAQPSTTFQVLDAKPDGQLCWDGSAKGIYPK